MITKTITLSALCAAAFLVTSVRAQTYMENGDAGQTLGTAQYTGMGNGNPLTMISGNISGINDADLFYFTITTPTMFSASTVGNSTLDTALFLFTNGGAPIFTNDDASGMSLQSMLPMGSSFTMSLAPGTYILGISLSGNEPVNVNNQLLFAGYTAGDPTSVRGAAAGLNPNALFNFNNGAGFAESGAYGILLTASATAAIPEPSTIALGLIGVLGLGALARKRRSSTI